MLHEVQGFLQHDVYSLYMEEDAECTKYVKKALINDITPDANIILSHVLYKIKVTKEEE